MVTAVDINEKRQRFNAELPVLARSVRMVSLPIQLEGQPRQTGIKQ
jgi:hypothetical protein